MTSLRTEPFLCPQTIELSNFAKAWDIGIRTYFMNSLVLTLIKVPTGVFICSLAAFALAKMRLRGAQGHLHDLRPRTGRRQCK